jgi:hypothetical protein
VRVLPDVEKDNIFRNLPHVQQNSGTQFPFLILSMDFGGRNAPRIAQLEATSARRSRAFRIAQALRNRVGGNVFDLTIELPNRPGALADMGEAFGRAGVSIEGGGAFVVDGRGVAHFLFHDGVAARRALEAAGISVSAVCEVLVQRLHQAQPGQLGKITRRMADAGVNIEVMYSDHDHQLILVVDDLEKARAVSEAWTREQQRRTD